MHPTGCRQIRTGGSGGPGETQGCRSQPGPRGVWWPGMVLSIRPFPEGETPAGKRSRALLVLGTTMQSLGPVVMRDKRWLIDRLVNDRYLRHEGKLLWDKRRDALYLLATLRRERPPDPDPEHHEKRVVSMDPGTRCFQTLYDPATGAHGVLLDTYRRWDHRQAILESHTVHRELDRREDRIQRRLHRLESTQPWRDLRQNPHGRQARWMRRECQAHDQRARWERWCHRRAHQAKRQTKRRLDRDRARLHGYKQTMHYTAIHWLWERWDVVIASTASFGRMARRDHRPFGPRAAQRGLEWAHYTFRQRLLSSAFRRAGKYVIETDEWWTTRTCGRCGRIRSPLGGSKVFECEDLRCGARLDRDVNGADQGRPGVQGVRGVRNIALRVMTKQLRGSS